MTNRRIFAGLGKTLGVVPSVFFLLGSSIALTTTAFGQDALLRSAGRQSQSGSAFSDSTDVGSGDGQVELPGAEGPEPRATGTANDSDVSAVPRRFHYELRLSLRGIYDDNINLNHFDRLSDYYFIIEPGITIGFGDVVGRQENYVRLAYSPSIFLFNDHSENDAVQHSIRLDGQYRFSRLTLNFSQDVQILDGTQLSATSTTGSTSDTVNLDVSGRTRLNIYATQLNASYDLTGKTFLSGGLACSIFDYDTLISSGYLAGNIFINYNYSPKLVLGIGGTGGYNEVDSPNPDQTFEQANVRATYQVSGKVSLNASAGVEFRQFEGSARGEYISPVFELGATWKPFDGTTITLSGSRSTLNSAVFASQDYAATNIIFGARQRLLQRIYLGLTAEYENANYFSTIAGMSATRHDNYYLVEPGIDVAITRFWTAGVYYVRRQNYSSFDGFSFYDNQVGLRTALTF
jgi:hypothetical protein